MNNDDIIHLDGSYDTYIYFRLLTFFVFKSVNKQGSNTYF